MKILLIGSTSFASAGLCGVLRAAGHEVWTYDRRKPSHVEDAYALVGNPLTMAETLPAQLPAVDVIINYLLLKGAGVEGNISFCAQLLALQEKLGARRLLHVSSVITASLVDEVVTEATAIDRRFDQKPPYSKLKIATELWLSDHHRFGEIVFIRPGFIAGEGLNDPIPGMAKLLPTQRLLGLGRSRVVVPIIGRDMLNEGILRLCSVPLPRSQTVALFTDKNSPTRQEFLSYCCDRVGLGSRPLHLPGWFWAAGLVAASPLFSLLKRSRQNLLAKFRHNLRVRSYDPRATEQLLDMSFSWDWKELLDGCFERQAVNYRLPSLVDDYQRILAEPRHAQTSVLFVGFGRIVQERHLPALANMGYTGEVEWYDPYGRPPATIPGSIRLKRLESLEEATATHAVIATPAGVRARLLRQLPQAVQSVLLEKPLALDASGISEIEQSLGGRRAYVVHNYRYKPVVQKLLNQLQRQAPGSLLETRLHFDSPAVDQDGAVWLRDEAQARTLLVDYALHFIDLATMMAAGKAGAKDSMILKNLKGQLESLRVTLAGPETRAVIMLRQGARQRRCHLEFVFQNYTVRLRFFPESMSVAYGQYTFMDDLRAGCGEVRAVVRKIGEKFFGMKPEPSHQYVLGAFLGIYPASGIADIELGKIKPFYEMLLGLADTIYPSRC